MASCRRNETTRGASAKGPVSPAAAVKVRTAKVVRAPMDLVVVAVGSLAAMEESSLSVKVPGRLESIPVDVGTRVEKGQVIAQIERRDYELKLKQAEAFLAQARAKLGLPLQGGGEAIDPDQTSTVREARAVLDEAGRAKERVERLFERKISSQSDLETAQAVYDVAANKHRAAVEEVRDRIGVLAQRTTEVEIARQQLMDSTVVAPFSGVIQERKAYLGEFVGMGSLLATLVRTDPLRLRLDVSERDAWRVREGMKVRLTFEGDAGKHEGQISRISPAIVEQTRMLKVEADIENRGGLRAGTFVRAEILVTEKQPALSVPSETLLRFAGLEKVFLVRDGKAVEKTVVSRRKSGNLFEISGDVNEGEIVIVNPGSIQNGQPVILEPAESAPRVESAKAATTP